MYGLNTHINTNRQIVIDVRMVFIFASLYLCVCVFAQIHIHHTSQQEVNHKDFLY